MNRFAQPPRQLDTGPKPFTWSYSNLKNYESCAQKHYQVDKAKAFPENENPQMLGGKLFHDTMAKAVSSAPPHKIVGRFSDYQHIVDKLTAVSSPFQIIQVELKLAITREFAPCGYFDRGVWFRGVVDYLKLVPTGENKQVALAVDYKTGKPADDPVQLALFAQLIFSHYPTTTKIRTDYYWSQNDAFSREDFAPSDMVNLWTVLNPRVARMEESYNTGQYPAVKNGLCKAHCPVVTCINNGRPGQ